MSRRVDGSSTGSVSPEEEEEQQQQRRSIDNVDNTSNSNEDGDPAGAISHPDRGADDTFTTPETTYTDPIASSMVSPGSVESSASIETVRPTNPQPASTSGTASASTSAAAAPRSPILRKQPSAPSAIQTTSLPPHPQQQQHNPAVTSPHLHPVSERYDYQSSHHQHYPPPPSVTSVESTQRPRRKDTLRAPLKRLASYSHHEPAYSDEDSEVAAEADIQAVQAELERSWDGGHPQASSGTAPAGTSSSGTVRHRRRVSGATSTKKGISSQKGKYEEEDTTGTLRRLQHTSQSFYTRDSDVENSDDERPQSRIHRHHHDDNDEDNNEDDQSDVDSQASYTLKDRQDAINITHPFGLKIWKPALYKKDRSVQRTAEGEIHSRPGQWPDRKIRIGNVLWALLFGLPMSIITTIVGLLILLLSWWSGGSPYARVMFGLAKYLFYPFGRFVELTPDEAYAEEDEGEGRSISEYERYGALDLERGRQLGIFAGSPHTDTRRGLIGRQRGHSMGSWGDYSERDSLLGGEERTSDNDGESGPRKRRFFGRGQWSIGRIIFFLTFYLIVAPMLLLVSGFCWLIVFALPMAKVMSLLTDHLRRHPLSLTFHSDLRTAASRRPGTPSTQVLLCTYRAWGWEYYKYTVDGTNIFFVNLVFVTFFTIADEYILAPLFHHKGFIVHPGFIFTLALASIMPLAYFIGMAVASISAQSSMGMGAAINAFFGSIVEVFLYTVALTQGKSRLVEGSVVGSIFAGILLMPGVSMLFGAMKRKTQRFNAKSAGVTSTMLLFAVIGAFAPTLFYQIYGTSELRCTECEGFRRSEGEQDCRRCYWDQANALTDQFYISSVKPFSYICAVFLVASYVIGLWFSLRTHASQIWETPPTAQSEYHSLQRTSSLGNWRRNIPDEPFLKRIGERISTRFSSDHPRSPPPELDTGPNGTARRYPSNSERLSSLGSSMTHDDSTGFVRSVAEVAAAAATLAVHNSQTPTLQPTPRVPHPDVVSPKDTRPHTSTATDWDEPETVVAGAGHDAPNWSRTKSSIILLSATILYAIIAEILVDTVDVVLGSGSIDEKFLGFTLFALVPNTTEFLNAISFALNGNIALSMEIGSAYALQVCLLQIPALVAVSVFLNAGKVELPETTFSLMFPRWDLITVILCVFLLAYMYGEGKSNYFKGSILMLAYGVVLMGGFYTPRYPADAVFVAGLPRTG